MISYFELARQLLEGTSLGDKLVETPVSWDKWQEFSLPQNPGRSSAIAFSDKQLKFPKASRLKEDEMKAMALHSFANHELLAIEMMASALLIYPHQDEESIRFKKGILGALKDEQKHLSLYVKRLNDLGYQFGDFPLNDFFWRQMEKLKTPEQYLAVMSLTFESANLDFAQYYSRIFCSHGDDQTAGILETVLEDEISHVAFGSFWMKRWRRDKSLWEYYRECLPWPMTPARARGLDFDPALHNKAMDDEKFMEELIGYEDDFKITRRG